MTDWTADESRSAADDYRGECDLGLTHSDWCTDARCVSCAAQGVL